MKTRILLTTALAVVALGAVGMSHPSWAVTDNGDIDAQIVTPISLECQTAQQALDFGAISAGTIASEVQVTTAGVASVPVGDAALVGTAAQEGTCSLSGDINFPATIDIADTLVTGPGPDMVVKNFTVDYNGSGSTAVPLAAVTLTAAASTVSIGATLEVADSGTQTPGLYTGTFTVDVTYD